ncbi:TIGR02099 family protein [Azohydromonas sp. G-1-1-14]|uniref:TIGR02099 family protein n=2 Tax=Azohydromonas caseinilytica TaxID=2728836 RepID=A0A848F9L7_9BURK|nr:TIGR02099 family protein [Azohydromonas caseinilytica]
MAVLHWAILPHAREWLPQIETHASRSLGVPVRIGDIELRGGGWVPALELRDVVLLDAQQREALRLPRVSAAVSARSLLTLRLRLEQLLIDDARLELRRDAQGQLFVAGLPLSTAEDGRPKDTALADWFFAQPEFMVRNARVRWVDEQRGGAPVELTQVRLLLRNGLRRHALRLDATPPPAWGQPWTVQGRFTQPLLARAADFERWRGTLYAELPGIDLVPLQRLVSLPAALRGGQGALRAWLDVERGTVREATLDVALRDLDLRLPEREPLALAQLQGRLVAQRDEDDLTVTAQQLGFTTADGLQWPASDTRLHLRQGAHPGGELQAQRLDLGLLARLMSRVPLPEKLEAQLQALAPEGVVSGLEARWEGPLEQPERYRIKGRTQDLSLAGAPADKAGDIGRPGFEKLDAEFDASEAGGSARLALAQGALEFPGLFEQPRIPVERFSAQLAWRLQTAAAPSAPKVEVHLRDARLLNADAQASFNATWRTDAQGRLPGFLDLDGKLQQGRAQAVARYLPLTLPKDTRHWVEQAVREGRIPQAAFRVRGDLHDFPYRRAGSGEFRIAGQVEGVTLAYVPDEPAWPVFTQVGGELVFERMSMQLRDARARALGVELAGVNGGIADLAQAQLRIEGLGRGPAAEMLRFVNGSPVGEWIGGALAQASATGNAELRLALQLPLLDIDKSNVQGNVLLAGNDVRLNPDVPLLAATKARVDFTRQRLSLTGGARVLGGDAVFEGGTQPDGALRFNGSGTASAEGLRRAPELGFLSRLAGAFDGQSAYRLQVNVRQGHPEFQVTTNLAGMASGLPAPLGKAAETALPLQVGTRVVAEGAALHEHWQVEAAGLFQAQLVRDLQRKDTDGSPLLLRGGLGVHQPAPQPVQGFSIAVALPALDLDAWEKTWDQLAATGAGANGSGGAAAGGGAGGEDALPPLSAALQVDQLMVNGRRLDHVVAGITRVGGDPAWRANLHADQLDGHVEFQPGSAAQAGHVRARLARLALPPSAAQGVESLLAQAPASVPALDIVVGDFELGGRDLGRVEIQAVNRRTSGRQAEWQLDRLSLTTGEAELKALGRWTPGPDGRRRMVMDFRLELQDSGALLQRLGFGGVLQGGKGRLQGEVSWPGSPLAPDPARMDGQLRVELERGRFLKADAGAGRLLSVLSLQSLPRRLTLDFRDVFLQGFAFDSITGDVRMDDGVAETNNLLMRGLQAAVLMEGNVDIAHEKQDLHVVVVPEINAGTASLAYAAINPAIGLGTFLAQLFLRKPLMQAGTREFQVTGPWSDPQVAKLERSPNKPLPNLDRPPPPEAAEAAAAASSPPLRN